MLTGCSRAEVEETIQPLVADAIEESDSEAEAVKEEDESPLIPEIDTDIKIHAGSRIAVVSKCVKGEYWKMVKKGMEDAVKEINKAYGYKKDDQITMTFEGPDNEEDVETQINTIDAVIAENPDVLCLQETKLQPDQYPAEVFEALGYKSYLYSAQKKGYSGVAILTKQEPDHVEYGMGIEAYDNEGRFIRADFGDLSVVSVYHPSGTSGDERQAFKMVWLEDFQKYVLELQKSRPNLILCGDYNICHEPIDIHDPVRNATNSGFLPEEREWMTRFLSAGYVDSFRTLCPEKQEYTWWSYRFNSRAKNKGWRIDYCMTSEPVRPLLKSASILNGAVHSDHCPMALEIER